VSAGWGIVPYGAGDWGSENTITPDTGSITTLHGWGVGAWDGNYGWGEPDLNTAPTVDTGVIPTGGAVLVGSAPVVVIVERVKTPGTAAVVIAGQIPEVRTDFFIQPAANDAVIVGFAPKVERSAVLTPPAGAVSLVGAAPELIDGQVRIPGTADLDLVGAAPSLAVGVFVPAGAVDVVGQVPGTAEGQVITPTGGAVIVGSAPVVVLRGQVRIPPTRALTLVGQIPGVAQSRVITPAAGQLSLVGGTPIIKNPNWVNIDDSQTPNWVNIDDDQTPNWQRIAA